MSPDALRALVVGLIVGLVGGVLVGTQSDWIDPGDLLGTADDPPEEIGRAHV